ncbi:hypothetical protein HDF16_002559 [Granulicella aggregans]|uniref:Uncharacterized protein n=1 Tax=Granulicella aggregans TaxID=474949 RepID=A0A7W7ZDQ7_9BACT|nr:hypothetical protein [Granulicella aggregans]MBB5057853.1 hypothetical protein [Granulicella aggregans]
MVESVRLSDASRAVADALANFDHAALDRLTDLMQGALSGEIPVEREPMEAIENNQRILAGVLMVTEQNLALLRRLRERKAGNEWAL